MLFKEENKYLELATKIIEEGYCDKSRTGIDIVKLHSCNMEFSLLNGRVPVLSTRYIPTRSPIIELIWFISGSTDIEFLKKHRLSIWDSWVKKGTERYDQRLEQGVEELTKLGLIKPKEKLNDEFYLKYGTGVINQLLSDLTGHKVEDRKLIGGSIGEGAYGAQWRNWEDIRKVSYQNKEEKEKLLELGYKEYITSSNWTGSEQYRNHDCFFTKYHDQLQAAIDLINNNPDSRRIIVSAWNPGKLDTQQLPPCHSFFQFLPFEKDGVKYLDLSLTCRSQDFLVGTVFNVMQYGVLCHLVAKLTGRIANKLYWQGNNTHIYKNQLEIFEDLQKEKTPLLNPDLRLVINEDKVYSTIDDFEVEDLEIKGYDNYHEVIKYPIAV